MKQIPESTNLWSSFEWYKWENKQEEHNYILQEQGWKIMHYTLIFKVSGPKDQLRMKLFLRGGFILRCFQSLWHQLVFVHHM